MCIIVDTDVAHRVLVKEDDPAFRDVHGRLFGQTRHYLRLAIGGQLKAEYLVNGNLRRALKTLEQAGRAPVLDETQVHAETQSVIKLGLCTSNDPHIIAIARLTGARVLCSNDTNLRTDFRNTGLLRPKGRIYQNSSHNHLLARTCS